jgi:hypothetical protein
MRAKEFIEGIAPVGSTTNPPKPAAPAPSGGQPAAPANPNQPAGTPPATTPPPAGGQSTPANPNAATQPASDQNKLGAADPAAQAQAMQAAQASMTSLDKIAAQIVGLKAQLQKQQQGIK